MNASEPNGNTRKRFKRGRRPGVKLKEYERAANPNDRPGLQRFSISVPAALGRTVRLLKGELDLEYSKIFRKGLDLVVRSAYEKGDISKKTYDRYWMERRLFKDDDMAG